MNQTTNGSTNAPSSTNASLCPSLDGNNRSCDFMSDSSPANVIPYGIFISAVAVHCALVPLMAIIGVVGNVLTLAVLRKEKKVTPMLVLQKTVTVCDLLFLIYMFPYSFYQCGHCIYQDLIERLTAYVPSYFTAMIGRSLMQSGRLSVALLTIDRAIVICFPLSTFISLGRTYVFIEVINCMILGTLIHDIVLFSLAHNEVMADGGYGKINMFSSIVQGRAMISRIGESYVGIFKFATKVAFEILPVVLTGVCNLAISRGLAKSIKLQLRMRDEVARARKERDAKINRTLLIITCCFVLLCLPGDLYSLFLFFSSKGQSDMFVSVFVYIQILMIANHVINFFIYCFSNKTYNKLYIEIMCCKQADDA